MSHEFATKGNGCKRCQCANKGDVRASFPPPQGLPRSGSRQITSCQSAFPPIEAKTVKKPHGGTVPASHAGKVYRRRFVSPRLAATLLANGASCFVICACPALVIKRDCSYISIYFSLEIAEISLPIASSGKSSGDSK